MLLVSLAALGPLCVLSGALFTAGSRWCSGEAVYLWEAVGSSAGGLLAGLVLVRYLGTMEILCLLAGLNLLAARTAPLWSRIGTVLLVASVSIFVSPRDGRGQRVIATRNSVYGKLAVVGVEGSRSVYENGVVLFNVPDPGAAEEAVHYALLEHPSPRSLLLIGGGINGSVEQALRHPSIERVDYVELDPAILDLARDYFPA